MSQPSFYSINNPQSRSSDKRPRGLARWVTPYYGMWWVAVFLAYLWFVFEWIMATGVRPFSMSKSVYIFILATPTLFSIGAILSRRWWVESLVLLSFIVFLLANLMYCRTYLRQIPLECYAMISNLRGFGGSVLASLRWGDTLFGVIWIIASLLGAALGGKRSPRQSWIPFLTLMVLTMAWWGLVLWKKPLKPRMEETLDYTTGYSHITPIYSPFVLLIYEAMESEALTPDDEAMALEWMHIHDNHTATYAATLSRDSTKTYPRRTLLVLVESLESWPIGLSIEGRELTPNLNRMIADSTAYYNPNVLTQTRGGRSIDAQLLYLGGMHPINSGVYSFRCIHHPFETLSTAYDSKGATSYLFSSDQPATWNGRNIDLAFGIDSLYMNDRLKLVDGDLLAGFFMLPYDDTLVDSFLRLTADNPDWNGDGRALGMMVTLSSHSPFKSYRPEYKFPVRPDGCSDYLYDYLSVVHYVDHCLGTLVDSLKTRPGGDRTMIAITGDHEAFQTLRTDLVKEMSQVDPEQHTPLLLINSPYAGRDSTEIGQVDVYSALLDAMGLYGEAQWRGMGLSPWDTNRDKISASHLDKTQKVSNIMLAHPEVWQKYLEQRNQ